MSTHQTAITPKPFFSPLESLRGIAALTVVIYHISWNHFIYSNIIIRNGALMVDLFFVLSGFVMMLSYNDKLKSFVQFPKFIWRRFSRIYPLHLVFLLVFLLIETAKHIAQSKYGLISNNPPFSKNNIEAFFANLTLTHSLGFFDDTTFNAPSWSISTEFYTYLLFALTICLITNTVHRAYAFIFLLTGSLTILIANNQDSLTFVGKLTFFRCTYSFFIGALIFYAYRILSKISIPKAWQNILLTFTIIALLGFLSIKHDNLIEFFFPTLAALLILQLSTFKDSFYINFLSSGPLKWLGKISYSIYIVHMAVLWTFDQSLRLLFDYPSIKIGQDYILSPPPIHANCYLMLAIGFILLLSNYTYNYIENLFKIKLQNMFS